MDNTNFNALLPQVINSLITDEWEAVEGYNSALATLQAEDSPRAQQVCEIFKDIINEEYVHIGQLESCLSLLEDNPTEHIEDGSEEGFEQLELPEDDGAEEPEVETESLSLKEDNQEVKYDYNKVKELIDEVGDPTAYDDHIDAIKDYFNISRRKAAQWNFWYMLDETHKDDSEEEGIDQSSLSKAIRKTYKVSKDIADIVAEWYMDEGADEDFDTAQELADYIDSDLGNMLDACDDPSLAKKVADAFGKDYYGDDDLDTESLDRRKVESKSSELSEKEMKKIICDMITKYDASEEETFDELQSQDPTISRETVHQLYQMCSGFEEKGLENGEPDFEASWLEMNELED